MAAAPERIGSYEVLREIGRGGMGVVYLALDRRLDRRVAIKCLPDEVAREEESLARFRREARLLASLNHPNIATVHGLEEVDGKTHLVLEYIEGDTLFEHLDKTGRSWRDCARVAAAIADALAAAHDQGVVHRDVKPDNVMVTGSGTTKVLDFGLACPVRRSDADVLKTAAGAILGTPGYMAPEQARGEPADARADVFALGCLLYEMIAGEPAFVRATVADAVAATLHDPPPSLAGRGVPVELDRLVAQCMEKRPEDRPASARALAADLRALAAEPSPRAATPAPAWRGRPLLAAGIVLVAAAGFWLRGVGGGAARPTPSLAVLPFANETEDEELLYLASEIPASIIDNVAMLKDLRVVPRSTTMRVRGMEPAAAGLELGADFVLIGQIQRVGGADHVRAELIDVARNRQPWSERFDRPTGEALDAVTKITEQVIRVLGIEVSDEEQLQLARRRPARSEAYAAYLKGRYEWSRTTVDGFLRAIEFYDQAIGLDPTFGLAYAGKSEAYSLLALSVARPAATVMSEAERAAALAMEHGPDLAETHTSLGLIAWLWKWDFAEAERHLRDAIALRTNSWLPHHYLAHVLDSQGRYAEAVQSSRDALLQEPDIPVIGTCLGHNLVWNGQREEGLAELRLVAERYKNYPLCRLYLGRLLVDGGTPDERAEGIAILRALRGRPDEHYGSGDLGWALGRDGQAEAALAELEKLRVRAQTDWVPAVAFAKVHAGLGEVDPTLAYLTTAVEQRDSTLPLISSEPHFRFLEGDPRYRALLSEIGLKP